MKRRELLLGLVATAPLLLLPPCDLPPFKWTPVLGTGKDIIPNGGNIEIHWDASGIKWSG